MFRHKTRADWIAKVADMANLFGAWRAVRRNHGGEGLDGVTIQAFQAHAETNLRTIQRALSAHTYQPQALKRVALAKPDHRQRLIGVPTVADRVVQHAIFTVLEPHFEPTFCPCSYGFRPGHSAHQAIQAVVNTLEEGLRWVVEADLQDFFDTLDWAILHQALEAKIPDPHLMAVIQRFLQAGALREPRAIPLAQGTPQGAVFSPLLANVYLTPFDRQMLAQGYQLIRYGDDFLTLHRTQEEAREALHLMQTVLEGHLKLRLNRQKTSIIDAQRQAFDFLSFRFSDGAVTPTPHAVERFQTRVQAIICAQRVRGMVAVADQLNPLIRGWGEYFKIGQVSDLYRQLDAWVATQLRVSPGPGSGIASLTALSLKYRSQGMTQHRP